MGTVLLPFSRNVQSIQLHVIYEHLSGVLCSNASRIDVVDNLVRKVVCLKLVRDPLIKL